MSLRTKGGTVTDNPYANVKRDLTEEAAVRPALEAIDALIEEARVLRKRVTNDESIEGNDTQRLASLTRDVVQHVTTLVAFLDVREWALHPEEPIRRLREGLEA